MSLSAGSDEGYGRPVLLRVWLSGALPDANQQLAAAMSNRYAYQRLRKEHLERLRLQLETVAVESSMVFGRVAVACTWRCRDRRVDPDNVAAGLKLVLDALVMTGLLASDKWCDVGEIHHCFEVATGEVGVMVELARCEVEP